VPEDWFTVPEDRITGADVVGGAYGTYIPVIEPPK
jgi:hypothetical protein